MKRIPDRNIVEAFMKILSFGSCNIDYVYDVEHIVQPGETVVAEKLSLFPGGKGLILQVVSARTIRC